MLVQIINTHYFLCHNKKKTTVVGADVAVDVLLCCVKVASRGFKSKAWDIKLSTCSCFDVQLQLIYLVLCSVILFFLPRSPCFVYWPV